ncbi:MAG: hypothetical protein INR73_26680 [Williamsia sp.]|nr:hypothetical protein [Williamsia sp.]
MKIKKFTLTNEVNYMTSSRPIQQFMVDTYYPQEAKEAIIYLIEIKTTKNPSDIILQIGQRGETKEVPLSLFKTDFIYIKDLFCLDTSKKEEFKLTIADFKIAVEGEVDDFSIDFYYSTDQKKPYTLFVSKQH